MDIERLRQAVIDKKFILSANPDWQEGRACGLSDDETEQKANDALTIILENIEELVVAYLIDRTQSATSEEVAEAIEYFEDILTYMAGEQSEPKYRLAITALKDYQPWIPCADLMPTEDDADSKGNLMAYFADGAIETWEWDEIGKWNDDSMREYEGFKEITHWRSMLPEPLKGETP